MRDFCVGAIIGTIVLLAFVGFLMLIFTEERIELRHWNCTEFNKTDYECTQWTKKVK